MRNMRTACRRPATVLEPTMKAVLGSAARDEPIRHETHTIETYETVIDENGEWDVNEPDSRPTSWQPVDLTDAVNGVDVPKPDILKRTDDVPLVYSGRVHWLQGESESLKSWIAQLGAAQVLDDGGSVLWIDFEDDDRGVTARLLALGIKGDVILGNRFDYVRPDEPLQGGHDTYTPASIDFEKLLETPWDLVIIDGVTEAMTVEGMSLIDNTDVARWMRLLPKRISATGAAVVVIDHLTKSRET
jgi:hypothetical protein